MLFYQGLEQERSQHNSFQATVFEIGTEKCRLPIFYEEDCIADTFCLPHIKRMWKHETYILSFSFLLTHCLQSHLEGEMRKQKLGIQLAFWAVQHNL